MPLDMKNLDPKTLPVLKPGAVGEYVALARNLERRAGFAIPPGNVYDDTMFAVTGVIQKEEGLDPDYIIGRHTWTMLLNAPQETLYPLTTDTRTTRLQEYIDQAWACDGGEGFRYGRPVNAKLFKNKDYWVIPQVYKLHASSHTTPPVWGAGTCGAVTWSFVSGWLNDYYNRTYPTSWNNYGKDGLDICNLPYTGKLVDGTFMRGYKEYFRPLDSKKWKSSSEGEFIWANQDKLGMVNVLEYGAHVIMILKFEPDQMLIRDPRTGFPVRPGPYRVGGDGYYIGKEYSGTKNTFRRWMKHEKAGQKWRIWVMDDVVGKDGAVTTGPLAGAEPKAIKLV